MNRLLWSLAALPLLLGGCSAESPLPVSAAAVSRTDTGYEMTAELIRQDSLDGDATPVYLAAEGETLPELFSDAERKLGGYFYFSHAETVLLDESLAGEGLPELVEYLAARRDARLTLRLVVAREAPAGELLQMESLGEALPGMALYEMLEGLARRGDVPDVPLYQVRNALAEGREVHLPALYATQDEHAAAEGYAVFQDGKMAGFVPQEEPK